MNAAASFLRFWEEVYGEALMLCSEIEGIPESCKCGNASMHLEGHCPCCGDNKAQSGTNCTETLSRLQADLTILQNDFSLISKPFESAPGNPAEIRRSMLLAHRDLEITLKVVYAVNESVVGFRQTCDIEQLQSLKRHAIDLRLHFDRLNSRLVDSFRPEEES